MKRFEIGAFEGDITMCRLIWWTERIAGQDKIQRPGTADNSSRFPLVDHRFSVRRSPGNCPLLPHQEATAHRGATERTRHRDRWTHLIEGSAESRTICQTALQTTNPPEIAHGWANRLRAERILRDSARVLYQGSTMIQPITSKTANQVNEPAN
jgi:hypothetical protein